MENMHNDLDSLKFLSNEIIANYKRKGFALIENLATKSEIYEYRDEIKREVEKFKAEALPLAQRDTYGKAFLQIMNLWQRNNIIRKYTLAKRFANVAAQLMQVEKVRIYHDQALFKEAGGGFTPWHQDQYYWPLNTEKTITMWMPLIDLTEDMGILTFASGSHEKGYIDELPISDHSQDVLSKYIEQKAYKIWAPESLNAGDATFHSGWTLHWAPANTSKIMREVMTVIYFADNTRVLKPDNANREMDLRDWLPGCIPGELAASHINPVIG